MLREEIIKHGLMGSTVDWRGRERPASYESMLRRVGHAAGGAGGGGVPGAARVFGDQLARVLGAAGSILEQQQGVASSSSLLNPRPRDRLAAGSLLTPAGAARLEEIAGLRAPASDVAVASLDAEQRVFPPSVAAGQAQAEVEAVAGTRSGIFRDEERDIKRQYDGVALVPRGGGYGEVPVNVPSTENASVGRAFRALCVFACFCLFCLFRFLCGLLSSLLCLVASLSRHPPYPIHLDNLPMRLSPSVYLSIYLSIHQPIN